MLISSSKKKYKNENKLKSEKYQNVLILDN